MGRSQGYSMKRRSDSVNDFITRNESINEFAFDTETTGLYAYKGARPFSLQISSEAGDWYFTNQSEWLSILEFINRKGNLLFAHNAKFDMHMLWCALGFAFDKAVVWDTLAMQRLIKNTERQYNLYASCKMQGIATTYGEQTEKIIKVAMEKVKSDRNEARKAKLLEIATKQAIETKGPFKTKKALNDAIKPIKEELEANYQVCKLEDVTYADVPDDLMAPYAIEDTRLNLLLGQSQRAHLSNDKLRPVRDLELKVTKVLFDVERKGVKLDKEYCKRNAEILDSKCQEIVEAISRLSGTPWKDSFSANKELFTRLGATVPKSFDKENLPKIDHPIAKLILEYRTLAKISSTYFKGFLDLTGEDGFLHPNFNQNVSTGRMSCSSPNLQNLKKDAEEKEEDENPIAVKEALLAPSDDYVIVQADYAAQEYRLAFDVAGEEGLIEKVKSGLDIHTATAQFLSEKTGKEFDRKKAKTINFLLLYGGGNQKLADALKISLEDAKELKSIYFSQLPKIQALVEEVRNNMVENKYVESWLGRRFQYHSYFLALENLSDEEIMKYPVWKQNQVYNKGGTFVDNSNNALNCMIQGGSADITKIAMVNFHKYLLDNNCKSYMICFVHDAIYVALHKTEKSLIDVLERMMIDAYPHKYLPMGVDIAWGNNFYEAKDIKELPFSSAARACP